jgi:hypothetical protein
MACIYFVVVPACLAPRRTACVKRWRGSVETEAMAMYDYLH